MPRPTGPPPKRRHSASRSARSSRSNPSSSYTFSPARATAPVTTSAALRRNRGPGGAAGWRCGGSARTLRDLADAIRADGDGQQPGRADQHLLELTRLKVQLPGEAEPVAQWTWQQAGPGGSADQGERWQIQRDGRRTWPLPTMTSTRKSSIAVYSISSAGRAIRWISSKNNTSPSLTDDKIAARSPACCTAGPLVIRSGPSISAAMIIAIVVLPRPGGPHRSTWSATRPRAGRLEHQRHLLAQALLTDELGQRPRAQRRLDPRSSPSASESPTAAPARCVAV